VSFSHSFMTLISDFLRGNARFMFLRNNTSDTWHANL
jgi:hypothetical protein